MIALYHSIIETLMKGCKMWNKERIHHLLDTRPEAVTRALLAIYALQTESEKSTKHTKDANNVGFSAFDAEFLSDLAIKVQRGWSLTPKQMACAKNKMKRYHRQLVEIANAKEEAKAVESDIGNLEEARLVEAEISASSHNIVW